MNSEFIKKIIRARLTDRWRGRSPYYHDNISSRGFRKAIIVFMACVIEKEQFKKGIDMETAVLRAIFGGLVGSLIGPMRYEMEHSPELEKIFPKIKQKKSEELVSYLSDPLQPVFRKFIVDGELDDSYEGKLVQAAGVFDNMLFCYREAEDGCKTDWFRLKYQENKNKVLQLIEGENLQSIRYLFEWFEEKKKDSFLFEFLGMNDEDRFAGKHNLKSDTVAEHLWQGAALGAFFSLYQNIEEENGPQINVLHVVLGFLFHDLPELRAGDANGLLKHEEPEWEQAFHDYETRIAEEMISEFPPYFEEYLQRYMVFAKDESYEGRVIAAIDKIDGLLKILEEQRVNPYEYGQEYIRERKVIQAKFKQPFVLYFLAFILHDLLDTGLNR
ncbi:hypothetical protein bcgnr5390_14000 [Bacillus luti]|nr:hypothetical protein BC2903_61410 [Bacillus cereus]